LQLKDVNSLHKKIPLLQGSKLRDILIDSYKKRPRKYVLSSITNKELPMSISTYNNLLKNIFSKNISQNMLRKSAVNYYYDTKNKLTFKEKSLIAKYMRHSVGTAMSEYQKFNIE
jgi:hypothetical protein